MRSGRCVVRLAALVALAATACGDAAATAPSPGPDDPPPAETGQPLVPPGRAKPVADPAARPLRSEALLRALATLDESDDPLACESARREILAAGAAGLDALLDWLADEDDDLRREARELIPTFGLGGFRALAEVLVGDDLTNRTGDAVRVLSENEALWARSDFAAEIARAAWAVCADEYGRPESDVLALVVAPGDLASGLAPEILARCRGDRAAAWLDALEQRDVIHAAAELLRSSAADLVSLLRSEDDDIWEPARDLLAAMRGPPAVVRDTVVRTANDSASEERYLCAHIVAAWTAEDPRCAEAARDLLATGDPSMRRAVIEGWESSPRLSPDDLVAAARCVVDPDDDVAEAAASLLGSAHALADGVRDAWARALEAAGGADAVALCSALLRFGARHEDTGSVPILDSLLPSLLRLASVQDPDVAVAAFRVIFEIPWELRSNASAIGVARLDDPDPRVRAWACWFADLTDDDEDGQSDLDRRIASVARPLIASLGASLERELAYVTLRYTDPDAARALAPALLADPHEIMRLQAEYELGTGAAAGAVGSETIAALVQRLRDDSGRSRALAVLLRVEGGRGPALAWINEWLLGDTPDSKAEVLRLVVEHRTDLADALPLIRRLRDREGYRAVADVALAAMESDDETALRLLATALPAAGPRDREVAWYRLLDLGAPGAALIVRTIHPTSTPDDGRWIAENEHDAVVAEIAALAASSDRATRRHAAGWTTALPADDAIRLLRTLIRDADEDVRIDAMNAAAELAGRLPAVRAEVAAWCVPFVSAGDDAFGGFVRHRAVAVLATTPTLPDGGAAALCAAIGSAEAEVRFVAAAGAVVHGLTDDRAIPAFTRGLLDFVRGDISESRWFPGIDEDMASMAALAARAVTRLGLRIVALGPSLPPTLAASDPPVRLALIEAVRAAGPAASECVPVLRDIVARAVRHGTADESHAAAVRALGAIGVAARPAIQDLRAASRIASLRDAAESAIRAIEAAR